MKMGALEKVFVNSGARSGRVGRRARKLMALAEARPGQRYLEIGCGNGAAAVCLARELSLDVTGVDIDPDQIREAERRSARMDHVRFLAHDGAQLPFENNAFDIVLTFKTTHHISNWEDALSEMFRVLKPTGYFVYHDFTCPGWVAAIGRRVAAAKAGFPTKGGLDTFIREKGLSIVHRSRSFVHYEFVLRKAD